MAGPLTRAAPPVRIGDRDLEYPDPGVLFPERGNRDPEARGGHRMVHSLPHQS